MSSIEFIIIKCDCGEVHSLEYSGSMITCYDNSTCNCCDPTYEMELDYTCPVDGSYHSIKVGY